MPLTDEALSAEVLTDETTSRTALTDETRPRVTPGPTPAIPPAEAYDPAREYSNRHCVVTATTAFLAVFLVSGFVAGTVRGGDLASALASAISFGVAGAGFQLLLMAVRRRRELEADAED